MSRAQIFGFSSVLLLFCLALIPLLVPYANGSGYMPLADNLFPGVIVYVESNDEYKPAFTIIEVSRADDTFLIEWFDGNRETQTRTSLRRNPDLYIWAKDPALKGKRDEETGKNGTGVSWRR